MSRVAFLPDTTFSLGLVTGIIISVLIYFLKQTIPLFIDHHLKKRQKKRSDIDEWCSDALAVLGELQRQHLLIDILNVDGEKLDEVFSPLSKELLMLSNSAPEEINPNLRMWLRDISVGHDSLMHGVGEGESIESLVNRDEADIPIEKIINELWTRTRVAQEQVVRYRQGDDEIPPPPDVLDAFGLSEPISDPDVEETN